MQKKAFTEISNLHHYIKETLTKSLTGDPDVVQLRRLLHRLSAECSQSKLQLLPVQWVPHPHLLRSEKAIRLSIAHILLTCVVLNPPHLSYFIDISLWPFRNPEVWLTAVSVRFPPTVWSDWHTGPVQSPPTSHTPAPWSTDWTEHSYHWKKHHCS